jgi:5-methylcytosine-specific restriction endonuclease McrA
MHWKREYGKRTVYLVTCLACDIKFGSTRRDGKYCSDECKGNAYRRRTMCELPRDHAVRILIEHRFTRLPAGHPVVMLMLSRECAWCGATFTATRASQTNCSQHCKRKAMRYRRRGREHGSTSHFTWGEFMRLFIAAGRRCAYCDMEIAGQPDPDHVVPLSRGGSNSITNILPSCRACNSDKRDLLLDEWKADRERRLLSPRTTAWERSDPLVKHLTSIWSPAA